LNEWSILLRDTYRDQGVYLRMVEEEEEEEEEEGKYSCF
jgi:hypothetical protein